MQDKLSFFNLLTILATLMSKSFPKYVLLPIITRQSVKILQINETKLTILYGHRDKQNFQQKNKVTHSNYCISDILCSTEA